MVSKMTRKIGSVLFGAFCVYFFGYLNEGSMLIGVKSLPLPKLEILPNTQTYFVSAEKEVKVDERFITDSMQLLFSDNFDGDSLDLAKWFPGPKPDGGQWGGAHFVTSQEIGFSSVYIVKNGMLTLRAHHDYNYKDPEKWGRTWYGGQISSAFPNKLPLNAIRKGYIETRAKFPKNKGSWPGFWMLAGDTEPTTALDAGGVEIDGFEFYGDAITMFSSGAIDWPGKTGRSAEPSKIAWTDTKTDLTNEFHTYGVQITDTEAVIFFDRKEVQRLKLPRYKTVGKFIVILDNSIHTNNGVDVPPSGYADAIFDYVRMWEDKK